MQPTEVKRVISVNVGMPREARVQNTSVLTAIFKSPVEGRVALKGINLVGDRQADRTVHGGPYKAVYLYPSEHYAYWAEQLPGMELPFGSFGENLTSMGIREESVCIGDTFRIGSAVLQVTQPRMPCYKLGIRFGRPDMVRRFWLSGRSGIYFSIVQEGELGAGDSIVQAGSGPEQISVSDVVRLALSEEKDPEMLARAMRAPLYGGWKDLLYSRG
ncbi:MAG: MOSC domain-containing protein [Acidobacteriaceae bacterium]|nr:MOSC domain-containing protein [Acidobacteriaceae bacterium]